MFYAMFNLSCLYLITKDYESLGFVYLDIANLLHEEIRPQQLYDEANVNDPVNKCMKYYFESQRLLPNNIDIMISLAQLFRKIDKHKEALGYIDLATKINNKDYRVYYEGFFIYDEIGDTHTAKEMIKICLMLNVGFIKGYNAFGNILRKEKLYDASLKVFENALLREPDNVLLLNNYGNCFLEMVI
jgi:tetratricopeptide (TPR) repeat protein